MVRVKSHGQKIRRPLLDIDDRPCCALWPQVVVVKQGVGVPKTTGMFRMSGTPKPGGRLLTLRKEGTRPSRVSIASLHRTQPSRGSKGRRHREAPSCSHREASIGVARIVVPAAPVAPVTPVVLVRIRSTDVAAITGTASTRGERSPSSGLNSATVFGCR